MTPDRPPTMILAALALTLLLAAGAGADDDDQLESLRAGDVLLDKAESDLTEQRLDATELARRCGRLSESPRSDAESQLSAFYPHRDLLERCTYLPVNGRGQGGRILGRIRESVKHDALSLLDDRSVESFLREALDRVDAEDAASRAHRVADSHASRTSSLRGHQGRLNSGGKWRDLDRYGRIWQYTTERWLLQAGNNRSRIFKDALLQLLDTYYSQRRNATNVDTCPPLSDPSPICSPCSAYRTVDGTCNNLNHSRYGMAGAPLQRMAVSAYEDGIGAPRVTSIGGDPLPSSRKVSTTVMSRSSNLSSENTNMVMQWGQFVGHDLSNTPAVGDDGKLLHACCVEQLKESMGLSIEQAAAMQVELNKRYGCFNIPVPDDDPFYTNRSCLGFQKSSTVPHWDCKLGVRSPVNLITSYIDGSMVYGSSLKEQDKLRSYTRGRLKTLDLRNRSRQLLPQTTELLCRSQAKTHVCFNAGDLRVNVHPGLLSMHVVLMREHNRVAAALEQLNPQWNDEKLFQEARKIVGGEIQHITYKDFLPIILGPGLYKKYELEPLSGRTFYTGYNDKVDASVRLEFASVAYRFGHSLIRDSFTYSDESLHSIGSYKPQHSYFSPDFAYNSSVGVSAVLRGLLSDPAENCDHRFTTQVADHLFDNGHEFSKQLDLVAFNIQRGREQGVPSYIGLRKILGMSVPKTFDDLRDTHDAAIIDRFRAVYASVADIDAYPGGVSERSLPGAVVGPMFGKIIAVQFALAKTGDRFYYENSGRSAFGSCGRRFFEPEQLAEIKKATLSRLLCDNAEIPNIRLNAFKIRSPLTPCDSLPSLNFEPWRERSGS